MAHQERAPFLDDVYAEVIINLWKAAEAIHGTWKLRKVEATGKKLGFTDEVVKELEWFYELRHSDEVAHAVIYRKKTPEQFSSTLQ